MTSHRSAYAEQKAFNFPARNSAGQFLQDIGIGPQKDPSAEGEQKKILLLQGPVGPFFGELHRSLNTQGFSVKRIYFNIADRLSSPLRKGMRFSGDLAQWEEYLDLEIKQNRPDLIVLFGSMRPAHQVARAVAQQAWVPVLSLEEAYLRSGYITCEVGGNNASSPLCKWTPEYNNDTYVTFPPPQKSSQLSMRFWATLYYLVRDSFSKQTDELFFHRRRETLLSLFGSWGVHVLRRLCAHLIEIPTIKNLYNNQCNYVLVPLQVPSDSQIISASRGWTLSKLIESALQGLRQTSSDQQLVFKLHPLDRDSTKTTDAIHKRAEELGLADRVQCVHTGRIGELTHHASGMIVINSTSAFSALHHNVPVLVLGNAIFRHKELVTLGDSPEDIGVFLKMRRLQDEKAIAAFFEAVRTQALLPGDFYKRSGRKIAVQEVVQKITDVILLNIAERRSQNVRIPRDIRR